jgi:hypothetical protein
MNAATQDIVVEEVLPHAPETIWKTLTRFGSTPSRRRKLIGLKHAG